LDLKGLIDWLGQSPRDPIISPNPHSGPGLVFHTSNPSTEGKRLWVWGQPKAQLLNTDCTGDQAFNKWSFRGHFTLKSQEAVAVVAGIPVPLGIWSQWCHLTSSASLPSALWTADVLPSIPFSQRHPDGFPGHSCF
jgi:hypothetical protein